MQRTLPAAAEHGAQDLIDAAIASALVVRAGGEAWGLFFVCCLYSVDVGKSLRRELI